MSEYYHLTRKSNNRKTGPIVTVTSSSSTCPDTCPFKVSGCYAKGGPIRMHWDKVSSGQYGVEFSELVSTLREIPRYANKSSTFPGRRSAGKKS
jgi:hypothetical protein